MRREQQAGMVLVWASLAIAVTMILLATTLALLQSKYRAAHRRVLSAQATSFALSGLHYTLAQLNRDASYAGVETNNWKIEISPTLAGPPRTSPDFRLETQQIQDWRAIKITAHVGVVTRTIEARARAVFQPRYPAGILATETLLAQGLQTDSFDSQQGNYRRTSANEFGQLWSFGDLTLTPSASGSIFGDCRAVGNLVINGDMTRVQGSTRALESRYLVGVKQAPPDARPLKIKKGELKILPSGHYVIDQLTLTKETRLICDGDVEIYARAASIAPGGLTTLKEDPLSLKLLVSGTPVDVAAPFIGIIDAPAAHVSIVGPGDFYGAILGAWVTTTLGVALHFDRSLPFRTRGPLLRWQADGWEAKP